MHPGLIPLAVKIGERALDRLAGSKQAGVASVVGTSVLASTMAVDPGAMLFPENPQYALIANSVLYVVGLVALAYKEKRYGGR